MASPQNTQVGQTYPAVATGLLKTGQGCLQKCAVSSSSSGTLTAYDNTTASGTPLLNAFPLTAGQVYEFDMMFQTGLYVTIGGTAVAAITVGP